MNCSFVSQTTTFFPIAQGRIDALAKSFHNKGSADYTVVSIVFGSLLVIGILSYLCLQFYRWQKARIVDSSPKLFNELCRAHSLSAGEKVSLVKLAAARQLKDPCRLFIDSQLWMLDPAREHELCKPKQRSILRRTRAKLFPDAEQLPDDQYDEEKLAS